MKRFLISKGTKVGRYAVDWNSDAGVEHDVPTDKEVIFDINDLRPADRKQIKQPNHSKIYLHFNLPKECLPWDIMEVIASDVIQL